MSGSDYSQELASEQCFVASAYRLIDQESAAAEEAVRKFHLDGDTSRVPSMVIEREISRTAVQQRLAEAREAAAAPICFGRLDFDDGEIYIGRRGLQSPEREPVVIDWRAPAAAPFYRATPSNPHGVVRRRHLELKDRMVVDLNDELLDIDSSRLASGDVELVGEGALLAALRAPRGTHMRDIVATIQAEQDVAVRSPAGQCLTIQGGPGTGKTAVALHRLAYLLYERQFLGQGVLVVGPSPQFLRYIRKVLPSLGAQDAHLVTIPALYFGDRRLRRDDEHVAALKGDARMARVLRRAVSLLRRQSRRAGAFEVPWHVYVVRLPEDRVRALEDAARRRRLPHNEGRLAFVDALLPALWEAAKRQSNPFGEYWVKQWTKGEFMMRMESSAGFNDALDARWPHVTSEQLVRRLYRSRPWLAAASRGILDCGEVDLLLDAGAQRGWTEADAPILDEARALLGMGTGDASAFDETRPRNYALAAVDEAQDLSPMAWRMVRRRTVASGLTIVGDVAQGTTLWSARSWEELARRAHVDSRSHVELRVGYRTPAEIMEVAAAVLAHVDATLAPPSPVRTAGTAPAVVRHAATTLAAEAVDAAHQALRGYPGTVAVIAPEALLPELAALVDEQTSGSSSERITIISAEASKGLEFDVVVLVEPASIVHEHERGWNLLYVAVTRALGELTIVHHEPLPWETTRR